MELLIVYFSFMIVGLFFLYLYTRFKEENYYYILIIGIAIFGISQFLLAGSGFAKGYKQGQIDALTNKIEYKLITNADSTKTWVKKEVK